MASPSAGREKLLRWYAKQDEVLQLRIRLLACQVAELKGTSTGQELPGACRGAREDRATFDFIADSLVKPLLSCRAREAVTNLSAPGRRRRQGRRRRRRCAQRGRGTTVGPRNAATNYSCIQRVLEHYPIAHVCREKESFDRGYKQRINAQKR